MDFVEKNNDALHASLEQLIELSRDDFIKMLFPEATCKPEVNTKKLALVSISSKFRVSRSRREVKVGESRRRSIKFIFRVFSISFVLVWF